MISQANIPLFLHIETYICPSNKMVDSFKWMFLWHSRLVCFKTNSASSPCALYCNFVFKSILIISPTETKIFQVNLTLTIFLGTHIQLVNKSSLISLDLKSVFYYSNHVQSFYYFFWSWLLDDTSLRVSISISPCTNH